MTDTEKIASLEKRIEALENVIKMLASNDEKEVLKNTLSSAPKILRFDFCDNFSYENSGWNLACGVPVEKEGCFAYLIDSNPKAKDFADPKLRLDDISIDASKVKYIHIKFKAELDTNNKGWYNNNVYYNAYMQFYFKTALDNEWTQSKSFSAYYCSGEVVDMYIETKHPLWKDEVVAIRFDSSEKLTGSVELYLIELLGEASTSGIGKWMRDVSSKLILLDEKVEDMQSKCDTIDEYAYRLDKIEKSIS